MEREKKIPNLLSLDPRFSPIKESYIGNCWALVALIFAKSYGCQHEIHPFLRVSMRGGLATKWVALPR